MSKDEQLPLRIRPYVMVRIEYLGIDAGYHVVREIGSGRSATEYDVVQYGPFDDGTDIMTETGEWLIANALRFPL